MGSGFVSPILEEGAFLKLFPHGEPKATWLPAFREYLPQNPCGLRGHHPFIFSDGLVEELIRQ